MSGGERGKGRGRYSCLSLNLVFFFKLKHYAKRNKSDRERQIPNDITCTWKSKKYNKLVNITEKKQTHRFREQISSYQWGSGVGAIWRCRVQHGK